VSDLVEGLLRLLESEERGPVNLGNPEEITILELATKIIAITGSKSRIEHGPPLEDDPRRRCPDISKARALLGWEPRVSLDEGLKLTAEWFAEKSR
jgi:dTDP-glucose 4,6-dehydratase